MLGDGHVKSFLHLTSSLQEDDTFYMLTKVYHKFLELKKEFPGKLLSETFSYSIEQPMDL